MASHDMPHDAKRRTPRHVERGTSAPVAKPGSRRWVEAMLIAHAVVHPGERQAILATVQGERLSPAARSLLTRLCDPLCDGLLIRTETQGQRDVADRVDAVTVGALCDYRVETIVALANALPVTPKAPPAWVRDLERGTAA